MPTNFSCEPRNIGLGVESVKAVLPAAISRRAVLTSSLATDSSIAAGPNRTPRFWALMTPARTRSFMSSRSYSARVAMIANCIRPWTLVESKLSMIEWSRTPREVKSLTVFRTSITERPIRSSRQK